MITANNHPLFDVLFFYFSEKCIFILKVLVFIKKFNLHDQEI